MHWKSFRIPAVPEKPYSNCNIWMKNSWKYLMHNHVDFLTFLSHLFDWQNCDSRRCKHSHLDANDSRWSYCLENLMRFSLGVIRTHHGHMPTSNSHISNLGKGSEKCCLLVFLLHKTPKKFVIGKFLHVSIFWSCCPVFALAPKTQLEGLEIIIQKPDWMRCLLALGHKR